MVHLNKGEHVWVCFEMARVQNAYAVQRLRPNYLPGRRIPAIHGNQELQKMHAARHQPKQKLISVVFSYIVIKRDIKDKKLWFQSITSFRLLQLIAQLIFVRFQKTGTQSLS